MLLGLLSTCITFWTEFYEQETIICISNYKIFINKVKKKYITALDGI